MKRNLFFMVLCLGLLASPSFASIPIAKEKAPKAENASVDMHQYAQSLDLEDFMSNQELSELAAADDDMSSGDKDLLITALLWFFLGWPWAAHRWYKGRPLGWNILYIITFAGFGIWWVVDILNILTGKW